MTGRKSLSGLIDQIRADIYLRLLDGRFQRLSPEEMDAELLGDASLAGPMAGIEIRARLDTLAGVNELPGWGPVLASVARQIVARQHAGEWRWVVTDAKGYPVAEGLTRRRPTTGPPDYVAEGGIVELAIPVGALARLIQDPPPDWAAVIADIAAQFQAGRDADRDGKGDGSRAGRCVGISRSGIGHAPPRAAAGRPRSRIRITPATTTTVGRRARRTWGRCADTTTGSSTKVAGR